MATTHLMTTSFVGLLYQFVSLGMLQTLGRTLVKSTKDRPRRQRDVLTSVISRPLTGQLVGGGRGCDDRLGLDIANYPGAMETVLTG